MAGLTNKQNKPDMEAPEKEQKKEKKAERLAREAAVKASQEAAAQEAAKRLSDQTALIAAQTKQIAEQAARIAEQQKESKREQPVSNTRVYRGFIVDDDNMLSDAEDVSVSSSESLSGSDPASKSKHKKRKAEKVLLDDDDSAVIQQRLIVAAQGLKAEDLHVITATSILKSMTEEQKNAYGNEWRLNMSKKNNTDLCEFAVKYDPEFVVKDTPHYNLIMDSLKSMAGSNGATSSVRRKRGQLFNSSGARCKTDRELIENTHMSIRPHTYRQACLKELIDEDIKESLKETLRLQARNINRDVYAEKKRKLKADKRKNDALTANLIDKLLPQALKKLDDSKNLAAISSGLASVQINRPNIFSLDLTGSSSIPQYPPNTFSSSSSSSSSSS